MDFNSLYLAIAEAFEAENYVEATTAYIKLLEADKNRMMQMLLEHEELRRLHVDIAIQYAIQKTLIRRIKGDELISIDLSLFSRSLPLSITYDTKICEFLEYWKDGSKTFADHKSTFTERYAHICKTKLNGMESPAIIAGDVYASIWLATDVLDFESHLPANPERYVNLGCGCGLFDGIYLSGPRRNVPATLIDIDESTQQTIEHMAKINDLTQTSFSLTWEEDNEPPSLVVSIRSCGFLYDAEVYDHLFRKLKPGSQVFLDVLNGKIAKTTAYFESLGASSQQHPRTTKMLQLIEYTF
jgi:hypothetical protein